MIRGVVEAGACDRITLYTGNDDHIILDLVTPFTVRTNGSSTSVRIKGGLLGHWSVWVKTAVGLRIGSKPLSRRGAPGGRISAGDARSRRHARRGDVSRKVLVRLRLSGDHRVPFPGVRAAGPTTASQSRPQAYLPASWKIAGWTIVQDVGPRRRYLSIESIAARLGAGRVGR